MGKATGIQPQYAGPGLSLPKAPREPGGAR